MKRSEILKVIIIIIGLCLCYQKYIEIKGWF